MTKKYTILYCEDDDDDLLIISDAFEKYTEDLRVHRARNGREGLQVLKLMFDEGKPPCMIILDINMPLMDGKQALREIRKEENYKDIPIVVFSTSQSDMDRKMIESLGADFIAKPGSYINLEALVKAFVDKCKVEVSVRR